MSDIIIIKRHNTAYIFGESDAGKHWMWQNLTGKISTIMTQHPVEVIDELIDFMKLSDLKVEEK